MKVRLLAPYNYDSDHQSLSAGLGDFPKTLTQQHQAEDTDINVIVQRFGVTGLLPQTSRVPRYGDFTGVTDFRSALQLVMQAEDSFMQLPAELRARFGNDPAEFLDYIESGPPAEELVKLGILTQDENQQNLNIPLVSVDPPPTPA